MNTPCSGSAETHEVRMTKTYHWFALLGLVLIPLTAIVVGIARHQTPHLVIGVIALIVIGLLGRWALNSMPVLMRMSPDGLYVKQYKCCFDWQDIQRVYVIDMAERMSQGEKVAAAATSNRGLSLAMLMGLEFTESGLQKHGVLAERLWQTQPSPSSLYFYTIDIRTIGRGRGVGEHIHGRRGRQTTS